MSICEKCSGVCKATSPRKECTLFKCNDWDELIKELESCGISDTEGIADFIIGRETELKQKIERLEGLYIKNFDYGHKSGIEIMDLLQSKITRIVEPLKLCEKSLTKDFTIGINVFKLADERRLAINKAIEEAEK